MVGRGRKGENDGQEYMLQAGSKGEKVVERGFLVGGAENLCVSLHAPHHPLDLLGGVHIAEAATVKSNRYEMGIRLLCVLHITQLASRSNIHMQPNTFLQPCRLTICISCYSPSMLTSSLKLRIRANSWSAHLPAFAASHPTPPSPSPSAAAAAQQPCHAPGLGSSALPLSQQTEHQRQPPAKVAARAAQRLAAEQ